jgi:hypothetical protein
MTAWIALFALALTAACSSGSSTATGATGTDGGVMTATMCDQACVDIGTGVTLANLVNDLYNTNLAGHVVGNQSLSAPCPLGGTADITGTTGFDGTHNITTVNLAYAMTGCQVSASGVELTVTGTLTEVGSFDSMMLQTINDASSDLTITGTVDGVNLSDTACDVHVNVDSNASPEVTGTVCGRTFR